MPFNFTPPQQGAYQGFRDVMENDAAEARVNQQSKLALQMQSKLLEQGSQQRLAEAQAAQAREVLPPDEMERLGGLYAGLHQSLRSGTSPSFDLSQFKTQPGQEAAKKMLDIYAAHAMSGSKTEAYQTPWFSDVTGQRIGYKSFNQMGQPIAQKQDPGAADKEKQGIALLNGMASLDALDSAEKGIDFGRVSGVMSKGSAMLGMDSGNMARFNAYKTLVSSMAAPLITGSHRFAPAEQAQLQTMLGSAFSTPQEVQAAANAIRNVYNTGTANLGLGEDSGWMQKHAGRMAMLHSAQPLGSAPNPAAPQPQPSQTFSDDAFNAALNSVRASKAGPKAK